MVALTDNDKGTLF